MKKIAFVFSGHPLKFLITYFHKFEENLNRKIYNESDVKLIAGIRGNFKESAFNDSVKFVYNDSEIHIIKNLNELKKENYDKVYNFESYQRGHTYHNKNTEDYETVYINIGERTSISTEINNELNGHKFISGSNCDYKNSFYDYKLNLIYFYYYYGFNYLRYKFRYVKKQNVLGVYWFPNYKKQRDEQISKIQELSSFPIDFYSEGNDLNTYECIRIMDRDNWDRNHISSWTDYETSVVGFVFETLNHGLEFNCTHRLEYLGEKTLKPLLFSFLKMPFILDCNPYSFIELSNDGYWFLNSEFFKYTGNDSVPALIENFSKSLDDSILFLDSLYKDNSGNLEIISNILYNTYKQKIDNNFSKIIEDVNYPKNGESLLNFILK